LKKFWGPDKIPLRQNPLGQNQPGQNPPNLVKPQLLLINLNYLNLYNGLKNWLYYLVLELNLKINVKINLKMEIIFLKRNNFLKMKKISLNDKIQKFLIVIFKFNLNCKGITYLIFNKIKT